LIIVMILGFDKNLSSHVALTDNKIPKEDLGILQYITIFYLAINVFLAISFVATNKKVVRIMKLYDKDMALLDDNKYLEASFRNSLKADLRKATRNETETENNIESNTNFNDSKRMSNTSNNRYLAKKEFRCVHFNESGKEVMRTSLESSYMRKSVGNESSESIADISKGNKPEDSDQQISRGANMVRRNSSADPPFNSVFNPYSSQLHHSLSNPPPNKNIKPVFQSNNKANNRSIRNSLHFPNYQSNQTQPITFNNKTGLTEIPRISNRNNQKFQTFASLDSNINIQEAYFQTRISQLRIMALIYLCYSVSYLIYTLLLIFVLDDNAHLRVYKNDQYLIPKNEPSAFLHFLINVISMLPQIANFTVFYALIKKGLNQQNPTQKKDQEQNFLSEEDMDYNQYIYFKESESGMDRDITEGAYNISNDDDVGFGRRENEYPDKAENYNGCVADEPQVGLDDHMNCYPYIRDGERNKMNSKGNTVKEGSVDLIVVSQGDPTSYLRSETNCTSKGKTLRASNQTKLKKNSDLRLSDGEKFLLDD